MGDQSQTKLDVWLLSVSLSLGQSRVEIISEMTFESTVPKRQEDEDSTWCGIGSFF